MFKLGTSGHVFSWQGGAIVQVHNENERWIGAFYIGRYAYGRTVKDVITAIEGWLQEKVFDLAP